ncbi:MAG: chemotaxis protein CheY [Friedmanniella sp.]|jgi:response regulator of citrate/malate metabolism|nr:chemotaxis protein CheY [Friedmanniella sp.]
MTYRVLVVEDEPIAAQAHASYVSRLPDFEVAGVAHTGRAALELLARDEVVDLVLLDMNLPDGHGLDLLRHLRAAGRTSDVIAVSSARELDVVKQAVAQGVVAYLIKPFTFAGFRAKLDSYADYRRQLAQHSTAVVQAEVDALIGALHPATRDDQLPKGLTLSTLALVTRSVRETPGGSTASDIAERVGTSRVTARRYLEHLSDVGLVSRGQRYGGAGRPEVEYRWR